MTPLRYSCIWIMMVGNLLFSQDTADLKLAYNHIITNRTSTEKDQILKFLKDNDAHPDQQQLAFCYHDYSKKIYQTDIDMAIRCADKAIGVRSCYNDTVAIAQSLYALGHYYQVKKNYPKALKTYITITAFDQENTLTAKAFNRIGICYAKLGDFNKAFSNFEKAERYFEQHHEHRLRLKNHLDVCATLSEMGWSNPKKAQYHLAKIDTLSNIVLMTPKTKLIVNQIFGNFYDEKGAYTRAVDYHKKALGISVKLQDASSIAMNYSNIGVSLKKNGSYKKAFENYHKALKYAGSTVQLKAPVYNNLGDYYSAKQHYQKALRNYQKAINYTLESTVPLPYKTLPSIDELKSSPYKIDLLGYLTDKANAWIEYYEYDQQKEYLKFALETFAMADQLVDVIRFESTEFQSKLFWRAQSAALYIKAVKACYVLDKPKEAFYFMEKNKAILLLEDLTQEKAKENAKLPEALSEKEFELKRSIYLAEEALSSSRSKPVSTIDSLTNAVYRHKETYEKYIDSLEIGYPKYYQYKQKLPLISFDQVKNSQKENDQVVAHYILNETEGYGLFLGTRQDHFFEIKEVPKLHKNLTALARKWTSPFYSKEEFIAYQELSHAVYKSLFPDIDPRHFLGKKMLIIPDHNVQHVPFEALMTLGTQKSEYLLTQCDISYAYSLSFLALNEAVRRDPEHDFIGFSPIRFRDTSLVPLTRSSAAITAIAAQFSGKVYREENASKNRFITNANDYRIIHLSTHADLGENTSPWIAFYDSKLSLEELYATKNQADLVVLSACNTSRGKLRTGEGVMSLARGFFSTGTRSVVATLWNANEKSTQEITSVFYENLKKGETKMEALQHAKRSYLQNHTGTETSPYYWGAPILIGNTDQIIIANPPCWHPLFAVGVLILAGGIWMLYRRS